VYNFGVHDPMHKAGFKCTMLYNTMGSTYNVKIQLSTSKSHSMLNIIKASVEWNMFMINSELR
jgi:hypothetical protein